MFLPCMLLMQNIVAQNREAIDTSTDIVMFVPSALGAGIALIEGDSKGLLQLAESDAAAVLAAYLLKYTVNKRRPDGSDNMSFPSNHTGAAFAGAVFVQRRYGWKWAVPAYAAAVYVGWGRVYAKRHDVWDVLAGAAIGAGSAFAFTTPFVRKHNITLLPFAMPKGGCGVQFSMVF